MPGTLPLAFVAGCPPAKAGTAAAGLLATRRGAAGRA